MAAPVLAIGDGALVFGSAVRDVLATTREQRCWFHKIANVLNALPKSAQPGAEKELAEILQTEDRTHTEAAAKVFADPYGATWPKAVAKVTDDPHQGSPQERHSNNVFCPMGSSWQCSVSWCGEFRYSASSVPPRAACYPPSPWPETKSGTCRSRASALAGGGGALLGLFGSVAMIIGFGTTSA